MGQFAQKPARGSSFLELMLVLVIVGVLITVSIASSSPESRAERDARAMHTALFEAATMAYEDQRSIGFFLSEDDGRADYQFAVLKTDSDFSFGHPDASPLQWVPASAVSLKPAAVGSELAVFADEYVLAQAELTNTLQAKAATESGDSDTEESTDFPLPPVLIYADGSFTPFAVHFRDGKDAWVIEGGDYGLAILRVGKWGTND